MAAGAILPPLFFGQRRMWEHGFAPWHGRLKNTLVGQIHPSRDLNRPVRASPTTERSPPKDS
jgi:hypothetical protein